MRQYWKVALAVGLVVTTAGCQRLTGGGNYAAPLPATPTTPVGQGTLQPIDAGAPPPGQIVSEPTTAEPVNLATNPVPEPSAALEIGRSDMLGGWKLAASGDNCMAFMTLTSWEGGYRANTRGCNSPSLKGISAWSLTGKQVVLKAAGGDVVAQLYATSPTQFNGQMSTGGQISLYR